MAKVLIVEDDLDMATLIQDTLEMGHHTVEAVNNGLLATQRLLESEYDLVVLDLVLPGVNGLQLCKQLRQAGSSARVLVLTGCEDLAVKKQLFIAGADDYLTKPFHVEELALRVQALLRRSIETHGDVLKSGSLTLDPINYLATNGGARLQLAPIEFSLLEFFMRNPNRVFSPAEIINKVWPSDSSRSPDTLRTAISKLRKKIEGAGQLSPIESVHGVGYRFNA